MSMWDFPPALERNKRGNWRTIAFFFLAWIKSSTSTKGLLEIKSLFFESDQLKTDEGLERLRQGIIDFAHFNNCESIEIGNVQPKKLAKSVQTTII